MSISPGPGSRRDFLRTSGGLVGWTALAARFPAAASAAVEARRILEGEEPASLRFLTAAEAEEVEEITAWIIPTDDVPGAREAGAVYFIDRALDDFLAPWADGFREGLADFRRALARRHPGARSVADLDPAAATAFLRSAEDTEFFRLTCLLTAWGTFADPEHGGNRQEAGWRIIGFEKRPAWEPPFGHYDRPAHGSDA